ncbi:MAG TPA: NAD(+) diphosphatase [Acidimicrobiales bacterium]|nr:NAD(+) diphosphatase [Acidimicrobiales bacterium]
MVDRRFTPLVDPPATEPGESPIVFSVRGDHVHLAEVDAVDPDALGEGHLYLGRLGGSDCWAVDVDGDEEPDVILTPLMALHANVSEEEWSVAGRAVQLVQWRRTHRFCGRCGVETEPVPGERAMRCPACQLLAFPRLAPAVITLVVRDDGAALLARNAAWPMPMFSCLAGFVEPGETLEQTVAREVHEEVGIDVGRVTYQASQPWPFPHSLMIGFVAEYAGGEIAVDGVEIAEAAWFTTDDLPQIPPRLSIARRLIDDWIARS